MDGALAHVAGQPADSCPYERDPEKTWQGVYRRAWLDGWSSET